MSDVVPLRNTAGRVGILDSLDSVSRGKYVTALSLDGD
jgi:hypothetical protein